ncbi:universal stress protein [Anthocerotibacter panamensis]|uniref:universal stress protein n=1 Tax=Anthocerotibacter panamensis TaxID=2857077 RepID=UPI001C404435|nr:universal stress protein [Anthocerotibacter panamensis]
MYKKILVAIDRSAHSLAAFEAALHQALQSTAELVLLGVVEVPVLVDTAGLYVQSYTSQLLEVQEEQRRSLERFLDELEERALRVQVRVTRLQPVGSPGPIICAEARRQGTDLIVLGRRGLSGLKEFLLGSVSNYVVHHALCTVLVVQGTGVSSEEHSLLHRNAVQD